MNKITIMSFAKINYSIDVCGNDGNGYHLVDMVMQQLEFHDDVSLSFEPFENGEVTEYQIELKTNRPELPCDEKNLAYRAALLMIESYGDKVSPGKIEIEIFKRIPIAAGMAGGSGNAAAVVHALNVIWALELSLKEIMEICAKLGSDVPFCAMGQARCNLNLPDYIRNDKMATSCARATGTGTVLEPVKSNFNANICFAKPSLGVSTKEVYEGIDRCEITERPNNDELVRDLYGNAEWGIVFRNFINVLEEYTIKHYPVVDKLKKLMESSFASKVLMSGSGPTVFAVFESASEAEEECNTLREEGYESYWTKTTK